MIFGKNYLFIYFTFCLRGFSTFSKLCGDLHMIFGFMSPWSKLNITEFLKNNNHSIMKLVIGLHIDFNSTLESFYHHVKFSK